MGKKQPSTTKQISEVKLPKWVEQASQENYNLAKDISGRPLQQYEGATVADPSNMTTSAYDYFMKNIGASDPLYAQASGILGESYGDARGMFGAAGDTLARAGEDIDINKWLNPWTAEVEKNAMRNLAESLQQSQMAEADKASSAGAFGGSRQAIQQGVLGAEGAKKAGDLSAQLRREGFDTATANALADKARLINVASGYTGTGSAIAGAGQGAAAGLADTAGRRQTGVLSDATALLGMGQQEQEQRQRQIDADRAKFLEARDYPIEGLNMRLSALGMSPYGKTETTTKTGTSAQQGTDWATTILGGLKMLMGLSDERDKTDIKRIGKRSDDVPLYSYRYKGDPKSYPKVVGPMAQDIEKKYPGAVKEVGGHKIVPMGLLGQ